MPVLLVLCAAVDIVRIVACFDMGVVDNIPFSISYGKNDEEKDSVRKTILKEIIS